MTVPLTVHSVSASSNTSGTLQGANMFSLVAASQIQIMSGAKRHIHIYPKFSLTDLVAFETLRYPLESLLGLAELDMNPSQI